MGFVFINPYVTFAEHADSEKNPRLKPASTFEPLPPSFFHNLTNTAAPEKVPWGLIKSKCKDIAIQPITNFNFCYRGFNKQLAGTITYGFLVGWLEAPVLPPSKFCAGKRPKNCLGVVPISSSVRGWVCQVPHVQTLVFRYSSPVQ